MKKSKRWLAVLLAALMMLTPAAEVYAANSVMTVSANEPGIVVETTEEEFTEELTEGVSSVEETLAESGEVSEEDVDETEESSEEVTVVETTEDITEIIEEETTEEATTLEILTEEETAEEGFRERLPREEMQALVLREKVALKAEREVPEYVVNGYRDVDYEVGVPEAVKSDDDSIPSLKTGVSIPKSYDARENRQTTSVKNQNPWGACWSFSAVATAESQYKQINGSEADLSEAHLVEFFYNDNSYNYSNLAGDYTIPLTDTKEDQGGNGIFTTWGLARWNGVANEATHSSMKYSTAVSAGSINIADTYAFNDAMHLENAYWINGTDKKNIKSAIMEYGGAGISYYYDEDFDSVGWESLTGYTGEAVYYNPYYSSSNHAVTVVGWDDNFPREAFVNTFDNWFLEQYGYKCELPDNNGAWLIKNSWGKEYGDDGYFWISYEDRSIVNSVVFAYDFANADNYDNNYQYDGSSGVQWLSTNGAAAVYTADMGANYQTLDAVGVGFASTSNSYKVKVYKDLRDVTNPTSGTLVATQGGKSSFEGYYTIKLDEPVALERGETFAVVIELSKTGKIFGDVSYTNGDWIRFVTKENLGETFYKSGSSWKDAAMIDGTMRIKAFTSNAPDIVATKTLHDDMVEVIPTQCFAETPITPAVKVNCEGIELTQNDYSVAYSNNINAGMATVTITGKNGYSGTVTKTFEIGKKAITKDMVTVNTANYTGLSQNPIIVKNGDVVMVADEDYTIKYNKTPINAGSYTATITGINNYSGSIKVTVKIGKTDINSATVSLGQTSFNYDGKAQKPAVTVKIGAEIIPNSNYSVKYAANINAGTANVIVTAKGSLYGKIEKPFTINAKSITSDGITYSVAKATYSGSELKPAVTVKDGTKKLTLNKDYTVTYSGNISAGDNAKATITGKGNYSGTKAQMFTIDKKIIASKDIKAELALDGNVTKLIVKAGKISLADSDYDYVIKKGEEDYTNKTLTVGDKYTLVITLKDNYSGAQTLNNIICKSDINSSSLSVEFNEPDAIYTYTGSAQKPKIVIKNGDSTVAASNYSVAYSNNINAGKATVIISGKGSLAGTKTIDFEIRPKEVKDTLAISGVSTKTYNGKEQTQAVKVKDKSKTLKVNKDYTVSYTNNTNAGTGTLTINLSDNYALNGVQGGSRAVTFTIKPATINSVSAKAALYTGNPVTTTLTVKAGKVVLTSSDYDATYENHTEVGSNKATVTVTAANSNFTGSKTAKFSISKESLAKATVIGVKDLTYTGIALTQPSIVVKNQAGDIIPESSYTVTYKNNVKVGKATVTIKANANSIYTGSKVINFKIKPVELSSIMEIKEGTLYDKTYTGSKLTYTSKELKNVFTESTTGDVISTSSYKIAYKDNINAGTATMIVTGKGNYTGTKEYNFKINKKNISSWTIDIKGSVAYNNGAMAVPEIRKMMDGKKKLVKGKDYTISCSGATDRGVARITVTGRGNYEGSRSFIYTVY